MSCRTAHGHELPPNVIRAIGMRPARILNVLLLLAWTVQLLIPGLFDIHAAKLERGSGVILHLGPALYHPMEKLACPEVWATVTAALAVSSIVSMTVAPRLGILTLLASASFWSFVAAMFASSSLHSLLWEVVAAFTVLLWREYRNLVIALTHFDVFPRRWVRPAP